MTQLDVGQQARIVDNARQPLISLADCEPGTTSPTVRPSIMLAAKSVR